MIVNVLTLVWNNLPFWYQQAWMSFTQECLYDDIRQWYLYTLFTIRVLLEEGIALCFQ